jgi:hypothetical protein
MNRARRALQAVADLVVTVLVHLGVLRFLEDRRGRGARSTSRRGAQP